MSMSRNVAIAAAKLWLKMKVKARIKRRQTNMCRTWEQLLFADLTYCSRFVHFQCSNKHVREKNHVTMCRFDTGKSATRALVAMLPSMLWALFAVIALPHHGFAEDPTKNSEEVPCELLKPNSAHSICMKKTVYIHVTYCKNSFSEQKHSG